MAANTGSYKIAFSPDLSAFAGLGTRLAASVGTGLSAALAGAGNGLTTISNGLQKASDSLAGLSSKITGAAVVGIGGVTAAIGKYLPSAIAASDATDGFKNTLKFAGLGQSQIAQMTQEAQKYADQTVYDLGDIQGVTAQLAANGVKGSEQIAEAAGNLNAVAGGTKDTYKSVALVITQTQGAGKLTTENWNQLSEAIPGAAGKLKESLKDSGAYTGNFADAMQKGQISAGEFENAIVSLGSTAQATQAATSTSTFSGAWGNLEATITGSMADVLNKNKGTLTNFINSLNGPISDAISRIGNVFSVAMDVISGKTSIWTVMSNVASSAVGRVNAAVGTLKTDFSNALGGLSPILKSVLDGQTSIKNAAKQAGDVLQQAFSGKDLGILASGALVAIPALQKILSVAAPLAGALGGVFNIAGKAAGAIGSIASALSGGGAAAGAAADAAGAAESSGGLLTALGPVPALLAATAGALAIFFTQTSEGRKLLGEMMGELQNAWAQIKPAISQIWGIVQELIGDLVQILEPIIEALAKMLAAALPPIIALVEAILPPIASVLGALMDIVRAAMPGLMAGLKGVLGPLVSFWKWITSTSTEVWNFVGSIGRGMGPAISTAGRVIGTFVSSLNSRVGQVVKVGENLVKGIWQGISNAWGWLTSKITGFGSALVKLIRLRFGIASPSKVMASQVGIWLPAGIGEGIDAAAPALYARAQAFADGLSQKLQASASISTPKNLALATSGTGQGGRGGIASGQPQVIIHQQIQKADSLQDVRSTIGKAAKGYFARNIVPVPEPVK